MARAVFSSSLLKAFPGVTGVLCDRAEVIRKPAYLIAAGLLDPSEIVPVDFFESVPGGGDAYMLKRILHDWSDEQCVRLLRVCRKAMAETARLLVVDAVVPAGNEFHPSKIMDIVMMAGFEGHERTHEEFRELFRRAGFELATVVSTPSVLSILEGVPA